MAADESCLEMFSDSDIIREIMKIQALVRGQQVRAHMKEIRQLYLEIVHDIDGPEMEVVWPRDLLSCPLVRKLEKGSFKKDNLTSDKTNTSTSLFDSAGIENTFCPVPSHDNTNAKLNEMDMHFGKPGMISTEAETDASFDDRFNLGFNMDITKEFQNKEKLEAMIAAPAGQQITSTMACSDTPVGQQIMTTSTACSGTPTEQQIMTTSTACSDTPTGQQITSTATACSDTPTEQQITSTATACSHTPTEQQIMSTVTACSDTPTGQQITSTTTACTDTPSEISSTFSHNMLPTVDSSPQISSYEDASQSNHRSREVPELYFQRSSSSSEPGITTLENIVLPETLVCEVVQNEASSEKLVCEVVQNEASSEKLVRESDKNNTLLKESETDNWGNEAGKLMTHLESDGFDINKNEVPVSDVSLEKLGSDLFCADMEENNGSSGNDGRCSTGATEDGDMVGLPDDRDQLLKLKDTVALELLWVLQAINSRKHYLRLKEQMQ